MTDTTNGTSSVAQDERAARPNDLLNINFLLDGPPLRLEPKDFYELKQYVERLEYELMLANDALASYAMLVERRDTEHARPLDLLRTGMWNSALDVLEGKEHNDAT